MSQESETVARFLAGPGSAAALVAEDAEFQALNIHVKGRDAVMERFTAPPAARTYAEARWTASDKDGAVQAVGTLANGAKLVLTAALSGGKITRLQQQMLPGAPRAPAPLKLPAALKARITNALKDRHPILISYVDEAGQPNVTFRGSTQALSDDQLALWIRNAGGKLLRSIAKNPKVALMYRDEDGKATYQFQGRARIEESAAVRSAVYETMAQVERDHDFARLGVAVVIDLDLVEGYAGLSPQGPIEPIRLARAP